MAEFHIFKKRPAPTKRCKVKLEAPSVRGLQMRLDQSLL